MALALNSTSRAATTPSAFHTAASASPTQRKAQLALAAALALCMLALAGCASSHPVTRTGETCASCHSDGRAAAATPNLSTATETGLTFAIESSADEVYLCTAQIADNDTVVPARLCTIPADEFDSITLSEPGLYALCVGDISSPSATVLINATDSGDAIANVRV